MSKIITKQFEVFTFSELSETAKEKALDKARENVEFDDTSVIEDFKTICGLIGIDVDQVYYSGFSSQGDGASFMGKAQYAKGAAKALKDYAPTDTDLHSLVDQWAEFQKRNFYKLSCDITQTGNYYHENTMRFQWYKDGEYWGDQKDGEAILKGFAQWLYSRLSKDYDYQTSENAIIASFGYNDCVFLESGKPYTGSL